MNDYKLFLESKQVSSITSPVEKPWKFSKSMFDFQKDITRWSLRIGNTAIFADCGLGKTVMELVFAKNIKGRCMIVNPLAVALQTIREAEKFSIKGLKYLREDDSKTQIAVTNYEMLHKFNPDNFQGLILDESSILKSYDGKFRSFVIEEWGRIPNKLAATATPAPNDFMELGNHAEFLGICSRSEMLAQFFVHDGGETQKWRLKGHAEKDFWKWVSSWAVMIRKPSDLGYDDDGFILPECSYENIKVKSKIKDRGFFPKEAKTLQERREARKDSLNDRIKVAAELVNNSKESWIVWCDLNSESEMLTKAIHDAVEVKGSDKQKDKESRLLGFTNNDFRVIVTKPSIAGWGLNWQHCHNMIFVGLSDSFEQMYQAVRRCWRFGQKQKVNVYVVTSEAEGAVVRNIKRKEEQVEKMALEMVEHMKEINSAQIRNLSIEDKTYTPDKDFELPSFV